LRLRAESPRPPPKRRRRRRRGLDSDATPARRQADEREFIPTEELAPDAAITFPVNI
jgi:hypothetical protein